MDTGKMYFYGVNYCLYGKEAGLYFHSGAAGGSAPADRLRQSGSPCVRFSRERRHSAGAGGRPLRAEPRAGRQPDGGCPGVGHGRRDVDGADCGGQSADRFLSRSSVAAVVGLRGRAASVDDQSAAGRIPLPGAVPLAFPSESYRSAGADRRPGLRCGGHGAAAGGRQYRRTDRLRLR